MFSIITIISSLFWSKNDLYCLDTDQYSADNISTIDNILNLKVDCVKSEINSMTYDIFKEGEIVYISVYGKINLDSEYKPPHEDFVIEYNIPEDVDEVYFRGSKNNDLKIIWGKNNCLESVATDPTTKPQ